MEDGVERLVLSNHVVEIHYDKTGNWRKDKIYIWDCEEVLPEENANQIINYLYEEGFIMDRRLELIVVRGGY